MNILVIPDQHADPRYSNVRADYLAKYIIDTKPDVVVNLGDAADMSSLSSYDKGKRSFHGRSYSADLNAHLDFQDRIWAPVKKQKKKMPWCIVLEGNHEHRIEKALDLSPELAGTLDFKNFKFDDYYDEVVRYEGSLPGTIIIQGITFAHYLTSGVMGRPIGGEHAAYSLLSKQFESSVVGHSHTTDYCFRASANGRLVQTLVAGCYFDYESEWAGAQVNKLYWRGLVVLKDAENGSFDPEWISLNRLKKSYGG